MKDPLVSIISINYNSSAFTKLFIENILKVSYPAIEVIIVDNGSEGNDILELKKRYSEVTFVMSKENLGFAGGNNLGITAAKGDYLLFINNDTEVDPDFLPPLVEELKTNPQAGMVCPKIIYFNTNIIQYAGSGAVNPYTGRSFRRGFKEEDKGQFDHKGRTELAHGAAMMVPRKVINEVGMMPELYFLYYEEIDWCESIKNAGYQIWFIPESKVFHKESMSIGKGSTMKTYYIMRNRLIYLRRNTKGLKKISWILFYSIFSIPKNTLLYLSKLEIDHLKAFWSGIIWNLSHANVKNIKSIQK